MLERWSRIIAVCVTIWPLVGCTSDQPKDRSRSEDIAYAGGAGNSRPEGTRPPPADSRFANEMGFAILRQLAERKDGQILISPHGLASALLLTWNGAAGATREAIGKTLELPPGVEFETVNSTWAALDQSLLKLNDNKVELAIANSLWAREGAELLPAFLQRGRDTFRAQVRNLDFGSSDASGVINGWVKDSTGGKISSIVPDAIPPDVILYIINALYFKGEWSEKFDKSQTEPRVFHAAAGRTEQVSMMNRFGDWSYVESEGLQAVRLPYGQGDIAMYAILPAEGQVNSWVSGLDGETWEALVSSMDEAEGRVMLPRFRFEYSTTLRDVLSNLGMGIAFADQADFSTLTPEQVAISDVLHKTLIDVNEEGSEASAATSVDIALTSEDGPPPFEFIADRPFVFAIRDDRSGALLFVGVVRSMT